MARLTVVAALLLGFAAGPAAAKGPNRAEFCGRSRCVTVTGEQAVWPLFEWWWMPFSTPATPRPAPFYTIRMSDPTGGRWSLVYVPSRSAMRIRQSGVQPYSETVGPYWRTVPPAARTALDGVVRGKVAPFSAPLRWR